MRMEKTPTLVSLLGVALLVLAGCGSSSEVEGGGSETPVARGLMTTLGTRAVPAQRSQAPRTSGAAGWVDYDTPETYAGTVKQDNIVVTMDDGTAISLQVVRPTGADGVAESAPLPTIVTFTPYNKNVTAYVSLGGAINPYFVKRGYNHVQVDVRGTGRSGGAWDPFSAREQQDYSQVIDWVIQQPWSNGVVGMWGISATATTALLAAKGGHPAIKAVFPIVPHGDIYRDVVLVGGQGSIAFLPAWMGVVTALATVNPNFYDQPGQYVAAVTDHLLGLNGFLLSRTLGVLTAEPDTAYDNSYWADKAPLEVARGVKAPTFIVGGLFDIFQRSEPLNYEALKGHTTAKLLIGPWHHLQASTGAGLPMDGVPSLDHIATMWFDRYLKNVPNGAERLPNVTQWVWGHERFDTSSDWPHPQARAQRLFLQGGALAADKPAAGAAPSTLIQQPFNGICSESAMQISLGLLAYAPLPCWYSDNIVQTLEATFDTAPLEQDLYINGPILADIWISTTAMDAGLVVRVSDLEPNGTARSLSSGLQTASLRAVDESRSRWLDGQMLQPWHSYTAESVEPVGIGNIVKVPVEVFPTSALIRRGHRLRISVGASNFPFAAMPIPSLLQSLAGVMSIYGDAEHPSSVVLPVVPASALQAGQP
ncbi:CocE/NonD family hydrolase [Solimonas sp. K1W22B-7]|uniref:CocE/NonD family hydrolase n=1 Tax=Solimonas sp. K1W22B-7 TaxID=2303331 RepID=UPI000E32D8EB|nr:CocE/NonD family hydrolase [Solimonas sp. K1W22B-7]AXQ30004.1 CocE/NonD family hydrolase [Solimonas sp. K1W22B-7]